jgi:acetate kinase
MRVLVVNAGSTSVKLRVVEADDRVDREDDLDAPGPSTGEDVARFVAAAGAVDAVGHRVVHGGAGFDGPARIDGSVRAELDRVSELAPLHNPPALRTIDALRDALPGVPAVACFDTAFHADLPEAARRYALPADWVQRWGIRRYGFHGLSCEWAVHRAARLLDRRPDGLRLVICHLGGGASVTAVSGGRSVDTTMGFTPTEGLVMATRSGDVDPGALAWLVGRGVGPDDLLDGLEHRSGLLGLTRGRSGDMRVLLEARHAGDGDAQVALGVYLHRLRAKIAGAAAAMGGLDALVFTGGVGENAAPIRAEACSEMGWMGLSLDPEANDRTGPEDALISGVGSAVAVLVVHAREELVIASQCRQVLGDQPPPVAAAT